MRLIDKLTRQSNFSASYAGVHHSSCSIVLGPFFGDATEYVPLPDQAKITAYTSSRASLFSAYPVPLLLSHAVRIAASAKMDARKV